MKAAGAVAGQVTVAGLMGGHSGLNIGEGRGNAIVFAARAADAVVAGVPGARLAAIVGGDKRNAIPREASAMLTVPAGAASVRVAQRPQTLKPERPHPAQVSAPAQVAQAQQKSG